MKETLEQIRREALAALEHAQNAQELDALRVKYLGKKGELTAVLKQMGKTKPEQELNCGTCGYNTCREKAIAVYQAVNKRGVEQLLRDGRVDYIFPADYREGTDLELTMQNIIRKMAVTARLEEESAEQLRRIGR